MCEYSSANPIVLRQCGCAAVIIWEGETRQISTIYLSPKVQRFCETLYYLYRYILIVRVYETLLKY